jgi:hypothetical protein
MVSAFGPPPSKEKVCGLSHEVTGRRLSFLLLSGFFDVEEFPCRDVEKLTRQCRRISAQELVYRFVLLVTQEGLEPPTPSSEV